MAETIISTVTVGNATKATDINPLIDVHNDISALRCKVDPTEADQGSAGNGASVKDLIDAVGAVESATLYFCHTGAGNTTTYTFSTSITITSNFNVVIENGAVLAIGNGVTLTVTGVPFTVGKYTVFSLTGTGAVAGLNEAYAEWFGFSTGATAANNATYMTAALAASLVVKIGTAGTYSCNPFTLGTYGTTLKGLGYSGGGVVLSYAGSSSFIILNANRCRIEDLNLDGPDAADGNGDIAIDIQNGKWKSVTKGCYIGQFDTGVKDNGYDNVIKETMIYDFGAAGLEAAGGANLELDDVSISDSASTGDCLKITGTLSHLICKKTIFGKSDMGIKLVGGTCRNMVLTGCHWESNVTAEIYHTQAIAKVTVLGGRMDGVLRSGSSSPNGTTWTLVGVNAAGTVSITNDTYATFTFSSCSGIGAADVPNGTAIELDELNVDENGNQIVSGFMRAQTIHTSVGMTSRYSRNITGVANNATTDIFKAQAVNAAMAGWAAIVANLSAEVSSHVYSVHADPDGVTLTEIGAGRDRNATVALTGAIAGSELTFTADTTAADWAGDTIIVTLVVDLTAAGLITYTDL